LASVPGERIEIDYEGTTLPGYFFRAPDAQPGEKRPLVVINNGTDGATSDTGLFGGIAANERGHHWMTLDGPGQQATLFLQNIPFRHDWEAVLCARSRRHPSARARAHSARPRSTLSHHIVRAST
jgi:hypothetical protein